MMVKVCGITNSDDALAAVEAGASALGFNFYPGSPRYLTIDAAGALCAEIPEGVLKVGVFVGEAAQKISSVAREVGLEVAQIHGNDAPDFPEAVRIWQAFRVDRPALAGDVRSWPAEAFLIDTPSDSLYGGTGRAFEWSRVSGLPGKIILAGGLDEENIAEAVRAARPWGVDACSRIESRPGRKDHEKMRRFIRAAIGQTI